MLKGKRRTIGMRLLICLLFVSLVPVFCARVRVVPAGNAEEAEDNVAKVSKVFKINPQDLQNLSGNEGRKRLLSLVADSRERLLNSWKDGTVDENADFEALHPHMTSHPGKPSSLWQHIVAFLKKYSYYNFFVARKERLAASEEMRRVFIYEKKVSESALNQEEGRLNRKLEELCDHLVEASFHQIKARRAGNGKVDLRNLPEYKEAVKMNKRAMHSLSDS